MRRFQDRIGRDLAREPLEMDADDHRRRLAELVAACAAGSYYELLEVDPGAGDAAIHEGFRRLARVVHPSHAERVGLEQRIGVLQVLFERATEAYLTLSDPHRRDAYDRLIVDEPGPRRRSPERAEEARRVARDLRERARELVANDDYHFAVELMRQAVLLAPDDAGSWALLGRAQRANPKWLHMAADSLRRALQLEPESVDHRVALARVEADRGEGERAGYLLREALERHPGHPDAVDALEALEARRAENG